MPSKRKASPTLSVIAHRGACAEAPENTVPAFERAIKVGSDAIETDVRCTRDNYLILMHDETVDRTTNGHGRVSELQWHELQSLDAGGWFDSKFAGTSVPLLKDVLTAYLHRIPFVLELKDDAVPRLLAVQLQPSTLRLDDLTFTSFQLERLVELKHFFPDAYCGYLTREWPIELADQLKDLGIRQICPLATTLTKQITAAWQGEGFSVRAWGVRSDELVRRCIECEVDGFTVDFPAHALSLLGRVAEETP